MEQAKYANLLSYIYSQLLRLTKCPAC